MRKDEELIKKLEQYIGANIKKELMKNSFFGRRLEDVNKETILGYSGSFLLPDRETYLVDDMGNVTGIYLMQPFASKKGDKLKKIDLTFLKNFKYLTCLFLWDYSIINPSILGDFTNLNYLGLINNEIINISFISKLRNLKFLYTSYNKIVDISPLASLNNIMMLIIGYIPPQDLSVLKNLKKLKLLYIFGSNISNISFIKNLKNLLSLHLYKNEIEDISKISGLKNIIFLDLSDNRISNISPLKNLSSIRIMDLKNNNISNMPKEIIGKDLNIVFKKGIATLEPSNRINEINLNNNPIENPPIEIIKKGKKAVIDYFKSLEGEKEAINEVKVILVGDGGSGKTSLVKQLLKEKFNKNESQTHGINIRNWNANRNGENIIVHFWDFGGQEIMHATHQFFLSKRSLYILVLDGRKDEKTEYWLKHIESFGGDSPILVVLNKIDQNPAFDVNRKFLKEKYKSIRDFYRISCAKQYGINDFSYSLIGELLSIEILKTTWAKSWVNVKNKLEKMRKNFISYADFKKICEKVNIYEESSQSTLVEFLNDLGIVIHFKDIQLLDTHVLEPKWVTDAVYKIINSKELAKDKGILKLDILPNILKKKKREDYNYPPDKYGFIIDLMMKFELCYEVDNQTILIPDLLEIQEPDYAFDYANSLKFIIEYDYFPRSVIPRFMVRMHNDIIGNLRWRTGVILKDEDCNCIALIKGDKREKTIFIFVNGERKRDYFSIIRRSFREINNSFEKLKVKELVPLQNQNEICIEYDELVGYELMGKEEYTVGKLRKSYNVSELLNGIEKEKDRKQKYKSDEIGSVYNIQAEKVVIGKNDKKVSKNIVNIGDNATFHGDVLIGNKIKDSFNIADSSDVSDDLKELLKTLSIEVAKIAEQLKKNQAERVAKNLQTFTNEATSVKPDREWWKLSAKGIKEAAKTVGDNGLSVLKKLDRIIPILEKLP